MENATYTPARFVDSWSSSGNIRDSDWRKICSAGNLDFQELKKIRGCRHSKSRNDMKNGLEDYGNSESGTVEWKGEL